MKTPLLLHGAAFAVLACSSATARIGETLEECKDRYGEVTVSTPAPEHFPEGSIIHGFEKAGMTVAATIQDNKVVQIMFWKIEKDGAGKPQPLNDVEIRTLLDANGHGQEWEEAPANEIPADTDAWYTRLGDKVVLAIHDKSAGRLTLVTQQFQRAITKNKESKEQKRLEGF
jgi:hypothetical protein